MRKLSVMLVAMCLIAVSALAQSVIKGRILDKNGLPVEGASVKVKGTNAGAATDKDGYYSLSVRSSSVTIIVSSIGFAEQEINLDGKTSADVVMKESSATFDVAVVGSRSPKRSAMETAVPVDIIPISKVMNQMGQVDLNQILQFVAPSFNSNRQSGSDGADHVDPATLRGLGPDQTLVLINGKRRHQSSLVNIYGSRGRGNTGTDLNAIPAAAIERIEILRDGASAQYGSDAIAGVINIVLKTTTGELTANVLAGTNMTGYGSSLKSEKGKVLDKTTDGGQLNVNLNYGVKLSEKGYVNFTGDFLRKNKTQRPALKELYPDVYRTEFGDASYNNYSFFVNSMIPIKGNTSFYGFAGIGRRDGDAFAWSRDAGSERNVMSIYPNGFNPHIQSKIDDRSISTGIKTKFGALNADFNLTFGGNRFGYDVDKTLNASMGAASPTHFDAGGFELNQNRLGADFNRSFDKVAKGFNLAFGTEFRWEQYRIFAGELNSWKGYRTVFSISGTDTVFRPAGAQGFPGFQPTDETRKTRTSFAAYVDGELDITKEWMVAGAVRAENYSDFGGTFNYKVASRLKVLGDKLVLRGSASTGFRAPSLPQINFSSTFTNVQAGVIVDQVIAPNSGPLAKAVGIPQLKQETSVNFSAGFAAKPIRNLSITVDAYQVTIKDRVVLTGLFDASDDAIGYILAGLNVGAAQFFTNAVDTKTQGIDAIATYSNSLGKGRLTTTLAANFNKIEVEKVNTTALLAGKEDLYFGPRDKAFLLASAPDHKINLGFDYRINNLNASLRFTRFSGVNFTNWNNETDLYQGKTTTDVSVGYTYNKKYTLTLGGVNIFDKYPTHHDPGLTETGGMWESTQMGFSGAFFFMRASVKL
jgi:iron complex outermembrane recepter protein